MWCWRRMEKISWTDRVNNDAVVHRVKEERNILHTVRWRKANWIGHILRRNCLLNITEGKIRGTRRRGRRRKQPLDGLKEARRYWKLKEEAQDRTVWRTQFGRGYGPVARQTTTWTTLHDCCLDCVLKGTICSPSRAKFGIIQVFSEDQSCENGDGIRCFWVCISLNHQGMLRWVSWLQSVCIPTIRGGFAANNRRYSCRKREATAIIHSTILSRVNFWVGWVGPHITVPGNDNHLTSMNNNIAVCGYIPKHLWHLTNSPGGGWDERYGMYRSGCQGGGGKECWKRCEVRTV
jgi:hypothetical protein